MGPRARAPLRNAPQRDRRRRAAGGVRHRRPGRRDDQEAASRGGPRAHPATLAGGAGAAGGAPPPRRALIRPPSRAELERRLRARSTDDDATVRRRLHAARIEIRLARAAGYEYWVVNDDLERAYGDLEAIVRAENCRAGRRPLAPDLGLP